jgi:hypothetical protein
MMRGERIGLERESNPVDKSDQLGWGDLTV